MTSKSHDFQVNCSVGSQNLETGISGRIALFLWSKNRHFGFKGLIYLHVSTEHKFSGHTWPWQVTSSVETCRVIWLPGHDQITSAVETCRVNHQGLSQDFKTARPNPAMIPKQPVQPVLGISIHIARTPGSEVVLREKKEYSTMEAPFLDYNRR